MVEAEWLSYVECVAVTDREARFHLRRAFYGGAIALLAVMTETLSGGSPPSEEQLAQMDAIESELARFTQAVKRGRA